MRISRKAHIFDEKNRRFVKSANVFTPLYFFPQRLHRTILIE